MNGSVQLVAFMLDDQRYGLELSVVERIVRAVEVISFAFCTGHRYGGNKPGGPVVPVVNVPTAFSPAGKELSLDDHVLRPRTARRTVALLVDSAFSLVEISASDVTHASDILPRIDYIDGVAKLEDGMILIHDLDEFSFFGRGTSARCSLDSGLVKN